MSGKELSLKVDQNMKSARATEKNCSKTFHGNRTCSLALFREYMEACGYFPTTGNHWSKDHTKYNLHICQSPPAWRPADLAVQLARQNITRILLTGDSHGLRFAMAVHGKFTKAGYNCKVVKQEKNTYTPGTGYFLQGSGINANALIGARRSCHSCMSTLWTCSHPAGGATVELEYISMLIMPGSKGILINRTYCARNGKSANEPVCKIKEQHELLFKVYLRDRYPDLLLVFSSFGHSAGISTKDIYNSVQQTVDVIAESLPRTTKQIFFTYHDQNPCDRSRLYNDIWGKCEQIRACNWILYDKLMASGHKNQFGFFDLNLMATSVPQWFQDITHMKQQWYETVIDMVSSTTYPL